MPTYHFIQTAGNQGHEMLSYQKKRKNRFKDPLMNAPPQPKIYHILHVDRLPSIIADKHLWCDAEIAQRPAFGTPIGMSHIKQRRLKELELKSHPNLYVGQCVPFYFCPRSIMLYIIYCANNSELNYKGGQEPIIHLEIDLHKAVNWAKINSKRWAFTLSNAGTKYFEDRCDLLQLNEINWDAINTHHWSGSGVSPAVKEGKQAEFLIEHSLSWHLVERIGIYSRNVYNQVASLLATLQYQPHIDIKPDWYY